MIIDLDQAHDGKLIEALPLSAAQRLTSSRVTSYRWEVLGHGGELLGVLDGVQGATLAWDGEQEVQGSGTVTIADLHGPHAAPDMLRIAEVDILSARLRPVLVIDELGEFPLGVFLPDFAPDEWTAVGRTHSIDLLDKATVLDRDRVDATFTALATVPVLTTVKQVIEAAGETVHVDATVDTRPQAPIMWPGGTPRLTIVNDLLHVAGFSPLWVDGLGRYRATPFVEPTDRPTVYEQIPGVERELVDGEDAIYTPTWTRAVDMFRVPNRVVAVSAGTPTLTAVAENRNPESPWSIQSRGRVITHVMTDVEVPATTPGAALLEAARRELIALSPTATVDLTHLPVPARPGDAVRFASTPAGIDARHVFRSIRLDAHPTGLMSSTLAEVVPVA